MMHGKCLCGHVTLSTPKLPEVSACHCDTCRQWSGGPLLSLHAGANVTIDGNDHVQTFSSSEWAERGFCSSCGTHLFVKMKNKDDYYLPAGIFPELNDTDMSAQIFVDKQPHYYNFSNETVKLTGDQVRAMHTQS